MIDTVLSKRQSESQSMGVSDDDASLDQTIPSIMHDDDFGGNLDPFQSRSMISPTKQRRPEVDHPIAKSLPPAPLLSTVKSKKVSFDTEHFTFHPNGRDLNSNQESSRCWYKDRDMNRFKNEASKMAHKVLSDPKGPFKRILQSAKQQEKMAQMRGLLTSTFLECRKVKNEQDVEEAELEIDRPALVKMYKDEPHLVGLEVFVLYGLRGEASFLCRRILEFVNEKLETGVPRTKQKKRALYARTSQTISRPSRVYMQELAIAQGLALRNELSKKELNTV